MTKPGTVLPDYSKGLLKLVLEDCLGRALIKNLMARNKNFDFNENINSATPGGYDPRTGILTTDPSGGSVINIFEELFHGYQDSYYGGTSKYFEAGVIGAGNIEFEAKLLRDLRNESPPQSNYFVGFYAVEGLEYIDWLSEITLQYTVYPKKFNDISPQFNYFLRKFSLRPDYSKFKIDEDMEVSAMFTILDDATCL